MNNPFSYYNFKRNRSRRKGENYFIWNGVPHESFTEEERLEKEKAIMKSCQEEVDGLLIAKIIHDFNREFLTAYPMYVHMNLGAVGPLQTMIGLAIKNGHITVNKED